MDPHPSPGRKQQRASLLSKQAAGLERENEALAILLSKLRGTRRSPLAEPSESSLNAWLSVQLQGDAGGAARVL